MSNSIRFFFLILISIGIHLTLFAQDEPARIKKLSQGSDVIVIGKVSQKESQWNESKTRIYTRTTVRVDEYLKGGDNGTFVEITSPGGEVGDVGELYSHMPRFENEEEVLVFLKRDIKTEDYKVLEGEEGKITFITDQESDRKVTTSNISISDLKTQIKNYIIEK